jgi:rubrerythrin
MAEDVTDALEIVKQSMAIEQQGREFYLKAAQTTQDEKGQETFRELADDEMEHFTLLQRQYDALKELKKWIDLPEVKKTQIDLDKPLFPKGKEVLEKAITAKSSDLDAVLFGLDIEIKSYDLYRQAALKISDALGKAMFEFLMGEEKNHFDILMMRYEYLAGPVGWQS